MNTVRTFAFAGLLSLVGCGGGGGSDTMSPPSTGNPTESTGTVHLTIGDNPIDGYDEVIVVIDEIRFLGSEDGQEQLLFDDAQTIDLLSLQNMTEFLGAFEVPAGSYNKIRLIISDLYLTVLDDTGNEIMDERVYPDLPANGKIDLNPQGDFEVLAGANLFVEIDLDAGKSIKLVETGNGRLKFRPVVFVDILTLPDDGRLVHLMGMATNLGAIENQFDLCGIHRRSDDDSPDVSTDCVVVVYDETTGFFGPDAQPIAAGDLQENDSVVVYGRFDTSGEDTVFVADLVAVGDETVFQHIEGAARGPVEEGTVAIDVFGGQGFAADTTLTLELAEGTQLYDPHGNPLMVESIVEGSVLEAVGVLVLSDEVPDALRTVLIFVDTPEVESDDVGGIVTEIVPEERRLTLTDGDSMVCVIASESATILMVYDNEDGVEQDDIEFDDIILTDEVEVFEFVEDGDCLITDLLVVESEDE